MMVSNKDYNTVKNYAELMNVSERTIHNDLKVLKPFIESYWLKLDKKAGVGIKVVGSMDEKLPIIKHITMNIEDVREISTKERQIEIMKMFLFNENVLTYQRLAEYFWISTSSIAADIESLDFQYPVQIESNQKGTYIIGTEMQIQNSIILLNREILKISQAENLEKAIIVLQDIYPIEIINIANDIVCQVEKKSTKSFGEHYIVRLFNSIVVLVYRSFKGFHHSKVINRNIFGETFNLKLQIRAENLLPDISKKLNIQFTEEDNVYFKQQLIACGVDLSVDSDSFKKNYKLFVDDIVVEMSKMVKVDLMDDEKLYEGLISHFVPMMYRLKSGIQIENPLLDDIKKNYFEMLGITWFVLSSIEDKLNVKLTIDEVAFMAIHFQAALERNSNTKKILIVCPTGIGTAELVVNKVKRFLPSFYKMEIVSIKELYEINIESVDFIISTVSLNITSKPVLHVSPLITKVDITNISNFHIKHFLEDDLYDDKPLNLESLGGYLSEFITKENIFVKKNLSSEEEILDFLIDDLNKRNAILEGFEESVIQREKMGTTALNSGVAIPHGNPEYVVDSKIVILTTENPIIWGGEKVDTVILICISKKDLKMIKHILKDIYRLIETKAKVKKYFSESTTQHEILKTIRGGNI